MTEIAGVLGRIGAQGSFATRRTIPPGDLQIEVRGVGRIRFPITAATARKLSAIARPARHGYKDQTRLDTRMRDTGEISRNRISIDQPRWRKTLAPELEHIRRDLGLPEGCRLEAQLHTLLIYAPGQFFVPHQDSEKTDDMIATLVVSLPSQSTGGTMLIRHHDEILRVAGSAKHIIFAAFYADCRHEVRPVKTGYRIVLTYNLIVAAGGTAARAPAASIEALARRVREFFNRPRPPRWRDDRQRDPPDRLVYLLDHEYTQRGLAWNRLKGADVQRAAALKEIARQLDCEICLAQADVHETWACEEEYPHYASRWGWGYGDHDDGEEDEEDSASGSEPKLTELIDSDVELRYWVGHDGVSRRRPKAIMSGVGHHELCYTKPSVEFEPFESEHEGYMGNWGNTVDRWYHRAAIVLWPRERTFVIRAKVSPLWAMGEIAKLLKAKNAQQAAEQAQRLLPFWPDVAAREDRPSLLDRTLEVAAGLEDERTAAALLEPFGLTDVTPTLARRLSALLDRYGVDWCHALLRRWLPDKKGYESPETRLSWLGGVLRALCRAVCDTDSADSRALARWVLMEQWSWVRAHIQQVHEHIEAREHAKVFSWLCKPLVALIESSRIVDDADLHGGLIKYLTENADLPLCVPLGVLRAAHQRHRPKALSALGLAPALAHCTQELTALLRVPGRAKDDWSISTRIRCSCKLCGTLVRYLRAPDKVCFEWPLAKAQRAHVHGVIDAHDVPVRHTTRRTGRPFTLVLEKTAELFERDAAERRGWQDELAWTREASGDFSG